MTSSRGMEAKGEKINFSTKDENIIILGKNSSLIYNEIEMYADVSIQVNNISGDFNLQGYGSKLYTDEVQITGALIDGKYTIINGVNEVDNIFVEDMIESHIKTKNIDMFSLKARYNKKENLIKLYESVKVIRNNEIIEGDYGEVNTIKESFKVNSNDNKKVKILIKDSESLDKDE